MYSTFDFALIILSLGTVEPYFWMDLYGYINQAKQ